MADKPRGHHRNPYSISILICIVTVILLGFMVMVADAAVTLVYFKATPGEDIINISWKTATEYDNAGFFVLGSTTDDGQFNRLPIDQPEFYPAEGDGPTGAEYEFVDHDVSDGIIYYYKLEAFGLDNSTQFFGPISANLGDTRLTPSNTPTQTSTPTRTSTQTSKPSKTPSKTQTSQSSSIGAKFTATKTPSKNTWTATPSRTPFSTAKPATNTPRQSGSQESTPSATTTIAPQGSGLDQTPTSTPPSVSIASNEISYSNDSGIKSNPSDHLAEPMNDAESKTMSLVRTGLIIGVFAIWGVLAVGGYYIFRQRRN